ncbi:MAG: hypothetical protein U0Q18_11545 [Bryobacteraceae bacterium]
MRLWTVGFVAAVVLSSGGCTRDKEEPAARQIGRDAYKLKQNLKQGAREAAQELRKAGKEAHAGWNEAKQENQSQRDQKTDVQAKRERQRKSDDGTN